MLMWVVPIALACAGAAVALAEEGSERLGSVQREPPSRWRTVFERLHPEAQVQISMVYDDNIYIQSDRPVADFIWITTPRVGLGLGDVRERRRNYLSVNYEPSSGLRRPFREQRH